MLKKKKKEVGQTKNGEKWWLKIRTWRASCIWKTGNSVLLAPPLASAGELQLFSVALQGWNIPRLTLWGNPVTVQCFSVGFFFPLFFFQAQYEMCRTPQSIWVRRMRSWSSQGFLEFLREGLHVRQGWVVHVRTHSEVRSRIQGWHFGSGTTVALRQTEGRSTRRQKKKRVGKMGKWQEERGWHFTLAFEVAANLPDKFWKEELWAAPRSKTKWLRLLLSKEWF